MSELLSLSDAAVVLGVSRRRVNALVTRHQLPAERVGTSWVIRADELRRAAHNLQGHQDRPMMQSRAWAVIRAGLDLSDIDELDETRRRLRFRAAHHSWYVHPGMIGRLRGDGRVVLGGRDAADAAGLPVEAGERIHVYVDAAAAAALMEQYRAKEVADGEANVVAHVVDDLDVLGARTAPDVSGRFVPMSAAWLDIEDDGDRAARLVLEAMMRA